ncbi:hypothetical protein GJ744_011771 [Endocarpon pusillum]|uniref:Uncharacterized protein n=1 Tax=Endocarpon pusillum TaxID=364733 RepID=A0A8H7AEN4_9EURO|nr:hypothetical protein GJ744_011771 [Endocarpon pusillum]
MTCSSRISRIIPTALPLTLEHIPADFQFLRSPSDRVTLMSNEYKDDIQELQHTGRPPSPSYPIPELPSILPPVTPMKFPSWRSAQSSSPSPITEHEGSTHEANQNRSGHRGSAISKASTKKVHVSTRISSLAPSLGICAEQDPWTRIDSSSALTGRLDEPYMEIITTSVQKRHGRQNQPLPPQSKDGSGFNRRRYSHVVRTEALAPCPKWRTTL